jgi:hypothetical protein
MAFSSDGVSFGPWESFQSMTTWTFQPGDGPRTLWAKVRNGVGVPSGAVSDAIMIDSLSPKAIAIEPPAGSRVAGLRPLFRVAFDEPIAAASWLDLGLIVQAANGSLVPGSYAYDPTTRTGTFTPTINLVAGSPFVVTVGNVRDVAGNPVVPMGSWSVTPVLPTTLRAVSQPVVLLPGGSSRIDLELIGAPLPAQVDGVGATVLGDVPLQPISVEDGTNSLTVAPGMNTTYRFSYAGSSSVAAAQVEARVLVRRLVSLVGRDSSTTATGRVGTPIVLTAAISPATSGVSVSFRLYRFDSRRRAWVYAGSKGRSTETNGRARLTWTPSATGSFYWRASVASTPAFANNISAVYRWTIRR